MYAIIYWYIKDLSSSDIPFPFIDEKIGLGRLKVFRTLAEADAKAFEIEKDKERKARVISIEGVAE